MYFASVFPKLSPIYNIKTTTFNLLELKLHGASYYDNEPDHNTLQMVRSEGRLVVTLHVVEYQ